MYVFIYLYMCVYRKLSRNEDNNMNICESMTLDKTE